MVVEDGAGLDLTGCFGRFCLAEEAVEAIEEMADQAGVEAATAAAVATSVDSAAAEILAAAALEEVGKEVVSSE